MENPLSHRMLWILGLSGGAVTLGAGIWALTRGSASTLPPAASTTQPPQGTVTVGPITQTNTPGNADTGSSGDAAGG